MNDMSFRHEHTAALGVIEQLRNALRYADAQLRRCVISGEGRDALAVAETFLASRRHTPPPVE